MKTHSKFWAAAISFISCCLINMPLGSFLAHRGEGSFVGPEQSLWWMQVGNHRWCSPERNNSQH